MLTSWPSHYREGYGKSEYVGSECSRHHMTGAIIAMHVDDGSHQTRVAGQPRQDLIRSATRVPHVVPVDEPKVAGVSFWQRVLKTVSPLLRIMEDIIHCGQRDAGQPRKAIEQLNQSAGR